MTGADTLARCTSGAPRSPSTETWTVTDAQLLRARVLAPFLSATLAVFGHHEELVNLEREAIAAR